MKIKENHKIIKSPQSARDSSGQGFAFAEVEASTNNTNSALIDVTGTNDKVRPKPRWGCDLPRSDLPR
jgi:hypothetical protein